MSTAQAPTTVVNGLASLATDHVPVYARLPRPAATTAPAAPTPPLQTELTWVSPAMASAWLDARHPNRTLRPHRVTELATIMRRGQWQLNGEPLIFCEQGRLLDGQNRLSALVESGLTLPFLCVYGVPVDAQNTLGQNKPRSVADILASAGQVNVHTVASGLKLLWQYQHGCLVPPQRSFAPPETVQVLAGFPGLERSLSWGASTRKLLPIAAGTSLHYLTHQHDPSAAKRVFVALKSGVDLKEKDPIYTLRERCLEARTRTPKVRTWIFLYWGTLCWNALRQDRPAPQLPWEPKLEPSRFPRVV